ncbi:MAG: methyltransferase domain-containing protein [Bacteroidia bacterium]
MSSWHYPQRSLQAELLDAEDLPTDSLHRNLRELAVVNRWLGGYRISKLALAEMQKRFAFHSFIDIGSGGGDTLHALLPHLAEDIRIEGWDLKADCIEFARQHYAHWRIHWHQGDFREAVRSRKAGVLFHAALFFHHFPNELIRQFIGEIVAAGHGLIINDLERHRFARHSIAAITRLWPGASYLVRHDAPLSVERAFLRSDWVQLLQGIPHCQYSISYRWAFRHQLCIWPQKTEGKV